MLRRERGTHPQPDTQVAELWLPGLAVRAAEMVMRFGLPAVVLTMPLEFTSTLIRVQLARMLMVVVALAFAYLALAGRRTFEERYTWEIAWHGLDSHLQEHAQTARCVELNRYTG